MTTFNLEREATIKFNDVFGRLPLGLESTGQNGSIEDFDAVLTDQARNNGHFVDKEFTIGPWPAIGEYGAVLLAQLREEQAETAREPLGDTDPSEITADRLAQLHPDDAVLIRSLQKVVVGIVNSAPRTAQHRRNGQNGSAFYVGTVPNKVEIYGQLPFFRGLAARGLLSALHRVPDNIVWKPHEQYRSSRVSKIRRDSRVLEEVDIDIVPGITQAIRLASIDTFGNGRLEVANIADTRKLLEAHERLQLAVAGVGGVSVRSAQNLEELETGELSIYINPTEVGAQDGPGYVEVVRKVEDPSHAKNHAYATLVQLVNNGNPYGFDPRRWEEIDFQLAA